jgi:hypothetical protein
LQDTEAAVALPSFSYRPGNGLAAGGCRSGIGGDWVDVYLNWRYTW